MDDSDSSEELEDESDDESEEDESFPEPSGFHFFYFFFFFFFFFFGLTEELSSLPEGSLYVTLLILPGIPKVGFSRKLAALWSLVPTSTWVGMVS